MQPRARADHLARGIPLPFCVHPLKVNYNYCPETLHFHRFLIEITLGSKIGAWLRQRRKYFLRKWRKRLWGSKASKVINNMFSLEWSFSTTTMGIARMDSSDLSLLLVIVVSHQSHAQWSAAQTQGFWNRFPFCITIFNHA